ncbi:hypothetical protein Pla52o_52600 [Novipirellula galeiformis]|uniref:Uncharacterized protein n=1 Tax=Novipirellula galeiformis TaxID=2528004 RepID=A0A5C6C1Z9_9BACT|nr:hypothetical protein Pla52o_52600 [Novipirellula galeiformis]
MKRTRPIFLSNIFLLTKPPQKRTSPRRLTAIVLSDLVQKSGRRKSDKQKNEWQGMKRSHSIFLSIIFL